MNMSSRWPTAPCCAADAAEAGLSADAVAPEDGAEGGGAADQDAGPSVARPAAVSRWLVAEEEEEEEEGAGAPAAGAPAAKVRPPVMPCAVQGCVACMTDSNVNPTLP